jgi:hypothetical protein
MWNNLLLIIMVALLLSACATELEKNGLMCFGVCVSTSASLAVEVKKPGK